MTFVSIRYNRRPAGVVYSLEIAIQTAWRHGSMQFGQAPPRWFDQSRIQNGPMFSLGTAPTSARTLLQGTHNILVDSANQQIGHRRLSSDIRDIMMGDQYKAKLNRSKNSSHTRRRWSHSGSAP